MSSSCVEPICLFIQFNICLCQLTPLIRINGQSAQSVGSKSPQTSRHCPGNVCVTVRASGIAKTFAPRESRPYWQVLRSYMVSLLVKVQECRFSSASGDGRMPSRRRRLRAPLIPLRSCLLPLLIHYSLQPNEQKVDFMIQSAWIAK